MAKKFVLRIVDETMYEKLDKAAKNDLTSVNSLINNVLKNYLKKAKKN